MPNRMSWSSKLKARIDSVQLARPGALFSVDLGLHVNDSASRSNECVKILSEHYKVSLAGQHAPPSFQLFLLNFPRIHSLVLKFFMR